MHELRNVKQLKRLNNNFFPGSKSISSRFENTARNDIAIGRNVTKYNKTIAKGFLAELTRTDVFLCFLRPTLNSLMSFSKLILL